MRQRTKIKTKTKTSAAVKTILLGGMFLVIASALQVGVFSKESRQQYRETVARITTAVKPTKKPNEYLSKEEREKREATKTQEKKAPRKEKTRKHWPQNPTSWDIRAEKKKLFPTCKLISLDSLQIGDLQVDNSLIENEIFNDFQQMSQYIDYDNLREILKYKTIENLTADNGILSELLQDIVKDDLVMARRIAFTNIDLSESQWQEEWKIAVPPQTQISVIDTGVQYSIDGTIPISLEIETEDGRLFDLTLTINHIQMIYLANVSYNGTTRISDADFQGRNDVLIAQGLGLLKQKDLDGRILTYIDNRDVDSLEIKRIRENGSLEEVTDPVIIAAKNLLWSNISNADPFIYSTQIKFGQENRVDDALMTMIDIFSILYTRNISVNASPYSNNANAYIKWIELSPEGIFALFCDEGNSARSYVDPFIDKPRFRIENGVYKFEANGHTPTAD